VLVLLLRGLDRACWEPLAVTFEPGNDYESEWPEGVPLLCLNKRGRLSFPRLAVQLALLIRRLRPSLVVSFLTYTNYLSALAGLLSGSRTPLLLSEHNTLTHTLRVQRFSLLKRALVRALYPAASGVIAVSQEIRRDLARYCRLPADRRLVIYNPVDVERLRRQAAEEVDHPWFGEEGVPVIAACGRLTPQKNYPLLLRALRLLRRRREVRLAVLGKGPERASLEALAAELGLAGSVAFLGFQANPFKYLARARALALSSSWEGLPMVLLEAMACGTAVVATRCPSGPEEVITDGVDGLLVPVGDEVALAAALDRLLGDDALRCRLAEAGRRRAEDFRLEKIVADYERLFRQYATGAAS
jgi:glycosyltransferase involved in cell wall biosynthesis